MLGSLLHPNITRFMAVCLDPPMIVMQVRGHDRQLVLQGGGPCVPVRADCTNKSLVGDRGQIRQQAGQWCAGGGCSCMLVKMVSHCFH